MIFTVYYFYALSFFYFLRVYVVSNPLFSFLIGWYHLPSVMGVVVVEVWMMGVVVVEVWMMGMMGDGGDSSR